MNVLDTAKYGYPLIDSYVINTDLALVRSEYQSEWKRQRRSFLHNASLITMKWQLPQNLAHDLIEWLEALPTTDFFQCELLTGNDASASCIVNLTDIRRTSGIKSDRIPFTTLFNISLEAETKKQINYQTYANAAADQAPFSYPDNLPLPLAEGFTGEHGARNNTIYNLTYVMNTKTLESWLAFVGFAGTAWFYHPMYSENVACGNELLRYISEPSQSLMAPDKWSVSIQAENMPAYALLGELINPTIDCTYDSDITYDDPIELYDCGGTPPPPIGQFQMPASPVVQTASATGTTTATATTVLELLADGSVVTTPSGVPVWNKWHTAPEGLPNAGVKFDQVLEVSRDGINYSWYSPTVAGLWLSLKTYLYIRLNLTGDYDQSANLDFTITFNADESVSPYAVDYLAQISMNCAIDLTAPTSGVVNGITWVDGDSYSIPLDEPMPPVIAGIKLLTDGRASSITTGGILASWFDPTTIGIGANYWVEAVKTSGLNDLPTGRISLIAPINFQVKKSGGGAATISTVSWVGVLNFYNQATGGNIVATNNLDLFAQVERI